MKFRLILDLARPAALNMAIDEMLMESQSLPGAMPALRFYSWANPAYSIGYFQSVGKITERFRSAKTGVSVVRRITGGGLVFHGQDITFSIAAKQSNPFFSGGAKDSYLQVNEAARSGLQPFYPKIDYADCKTVPSGRANEERVCFEAPVCHDLLLDGKKIVGASQRRKNDVVLYQSSIFLNGDKNNLLRHLINGFKEKWKIDLVEKPLSKTELLFAHQKEKERYASSDWAYLSEKDSLKDARF